MSAEAIPIAPSSMARRTTERMVSSSAAVGAPIVSRLAYVRTVAAPTNEPTFGAMPCACIASSQLRKPCCLAEATRQRRPLRLGRHVVGQVCRVCRGRGRALTEDLRRDPLGDLADVPPVAEEEGAARLSLDVDEAGRHHHPVGVDARSGLGGREHPPRGHGGDAVASDRQVAVVPPRARPVDDPPVLDHHVVGTARRPRHARGGRGTTGAGDAQREGREGQATPGGPAQGHGEARHGHEILLSSGPIVMRAEKIRRGPASARAPSTPLDSRRPEGPGGAPPPRPPRSRPPTWSGTASAARRPRGAPAASAPRSESVGWHARSWARPSASSRRRTSPR